MSTSKETNNFTRFLRNNAALLLMIFCMAAVLTVVLVVSLSEKNDSLNPDNTVVVKPNDDNVVDETPNENPTPQKPDKQMVKVYFASPIEFEKVSMEYTDNELKFVFNSTLDCWKTHDGVDLSAADGTKVVAMYDGIVVEVSENYGYGHTVKIDHGDNIVATYSSVDDVKVVEGQKVTKGEQIAVASTSASYEFMDGAHLHLEVAVNGKNVDPMPYVMGEKFKEVEKK